MGMDCTSHALQDEVVDSQRLFKLNNVNRQIMTLHLMIDYPILSKLVCKLLYIGS